VNENLNLNHMHKLYTLLVHHCNSHGDCAYWQDCGINFISLDVLCWVHGGGNSKLKSKQHHIYSENAM
jgi:hypothetical protein